MEVSTITTNVELSETARSVITELFNLHVDHQRQKNVLFDQLYNLWTTDGLITNSFVTYKFEEDRDFIYQTIVNKFYDEKTKADIVNVEAIYRALCKGLTYKTLDGDIILPHKDEKLKYRRLFYNNNERIRYHFTKLHDEFQEFLKEKKRKHISYKPLVTTETVLLGQDQTVIRDCLNRTASDGLKVLGHFKGMTSEHVGNKRKGGKKGNSTNSDEVNNELYLLFHYCYN